MNKTTEKRTAVLTLVRVTLTEKETIKTLYSASHYASQSAFIRAKLLDTSVSNFHKNRFEAELKAGMLVDELTQIGVHISQIVRARTSDKTGKMDQSEHLIFLATLKLLKEIKAILSQNDCP